MIINYLDTLLNNIAKVSPRKNLSTFCYMYISNSVFNIIQTE